MSLTGAAGTMPAKRASQSAVVRACRVSSSIPVIRSRFSSRSGKRRKRGSSAHSGRPTAPHRAGQNFSLLHIRKIQPSAVL